MTMWPDGIYVDEDDPDFDLDFDFDIEDFDFDIDIDFDEDDSKPRSEDSYSPGEKEQGLNENDHKRKRRKRNRRRLVPPRIVKNDVRRHYATMMANVCNSFDDDTYASFLTTFSVPHMRIRKAASLDLPTSPSFQEAFRQVSLDDIRGGVKWLVVCFSVIKRLSPDNTMSILSSQLRTRSDTRKTLLSMKMRFDFTRLHNVHPMVFAEDMLYEAESNGTASNTAVPPHHTRHDIRSWTEQVNPFAYFKDKVGAEMPRLDAPQSVAFASTIHFYIDEYKRIEMIEIADAEFV